MLHGSSWLIHGTGKAGWPRTVSATRLPSGYTQTSMVPGWFPWPHGLPAGTATMAVPNITDLSRASVGWYAPARSGTMGLLGEPLAAICTPAAAAVSAMARWIEWNAAETAANVTNRNAPTTRANSTIV